MPIEPLGPTAETVQIVNEAMPRSLAEACSCPSHLTGDSCMPAPTEYRASMVRSDGTVADLGPVEFRSEFMNIPRPTEDVTREALERALTLRLSGMQLPNSENSGSIREDLDAAAEQARAMDYSPVSTEDTMRAEAEFQRRYPTVAIPNRMEDNLWVWRAIRNIEEEIRARRLQEAHRRRHADLDAAAERIRSMNSSAMSPANDAAALEEMDSFVANYERQAEEEILRRYPAVQVEAPPVNDSRAMGEVGRIEEEYRRQYAEMQRFQEDSRQRQRERAMPRASNSSYAEEIVRRVADPGTVRTRRNEPAPAPESWQPQQSSSPPALSQAELDDIAANLKRRVRKVYVSESDVLFAMTRWKPAGTMMLPMLAVDGLPDGFLIQSVRHDKKTRQFVFVIQSPSFTPMEGSVTFKRIPDLFDLRKVRSTHGLVTIIHAELPSSGTGRAIPEFVYTPPVAPPGTRRIVFDKEGE